MLHSGNDMHLSILLSFSTKTKISNNTYYQIFGSHKNMSRFPKKCIFKNQHFQKTSVGSTEA